MQADTGHLIDFSKEDEDEIKKLMMEEMDYTEIKQELLVKEANRQLAGRKEINIDLKDRSNMLSQEARRLRNKNRKFSRSRKIRKKH